MHSRQPHAYSGSIGHGKARLLLGYESLQAEHEAGLGFAKADIRPIGTFCLLIPCAVSNLTGS